ncbi:GNAT family N-acetyltransferase [Parasphingopyxis algicola]|uniref:GNAT family N-acetyltransferase n=1 Tax=Parasphingopyxis algicola TaxID=2026624 RepID=UPI00159F9D47|nr:GNAT family N-acetyltransferase [Parasphingopyxis algicola]QLC23762.1 GNAT family N-acetyltransferase [Parasphingopyxis algicola]
MDADKRDFKHDTAIRLPFARAIRERDSLNILKTIESDPAVAEIGPFHAADLDAVTAIAPPAQAFLRSGWFEAADPGFSIVGARRADGTPVFALPLVDRKIGPFSIKQLAGSYWPFRSAPIADNLADSELAAIIGEDAFQHALGRVWRYGPVYSDDPAARRLMALAPGQGWHVVRKSLATCYELDLAALRAAGSWPKGSTARKTRARERKLGDHGEVGYRFFDGTGLDAQTMDAMAAVEANSWLARLDDGGDTKFLDPERRKIWETLSRDAALAPMLFGSLMSVGETPIAFTFGLEIGNRRYYIANNYHEDYAKFGPGKLSLYKDFEVATERGVGTISWGAGDAGYKTDMGAEPGPEILDLLFVRGGALAALLRPLFLRTGQ